MASAHAAFAGGDCEIPRDLRVLVVDDDSLCRMVVKRKLEHLKYLVTTATNGTEALHLLRESPDSFHLVLSDVQMPDMSGYRLLECIALEMDLPVIMMSVDGETASVVRGILHGAVDYLKKPIQADDLRFIWQHVVRREESQPPEPPATGEPSALEPVWPTRARLPGRAAKECKRSKGSVEEAAADEGAPGGKKARVVWEIGLHSRFVQAVEALGVDKAVPKRILELMGVEGLTRENVASHLQKYRLYLKRVMNLQAEQRAADRRGGAGGSFGSSGGGGGGGSGGSWAVRPRSHQGPMPPPLPSQHQPQPGGQAVSYTTVDDWRDTEMDAFNGALDDFEQPRAGAQSLHRMGSLPEDAAAAHAAVEHMDMAIHGINMGGLGGSMNGLDSFFGTANQTSAGDDSAADVDDMLMRQFLTAALVMPSDVPMGGADCAGVGNGQGSCQWGSSLLMNRS